MSTSSSTGKLPKPQIAEGWNKKAYFKVNFPDLCISSRLERSLDFSGPTAVILSRCTSPLRWFGA